MVIKEEGTYCSGEKETFIPKGSRCTNHCRICECCWLSDLYVDRRYGDEDADTFSWDQVEDICAENDANCSIWSFQEKQREKSKLRKGDQ